MKRPVTVTTPERKRCVIYTRVSSDSGLEQEFNSLDNQREAGEAYIRSQAHEGWSLLPATYDDGGFSGGSMERPALQRLLNDIRAGGIDIVVVYKVDRLTRSLADFARLVELFDTHGVSFVSVTQSFNTTSSMGRLTLNVLLSFAQFEREVTGERIRDKIAASKRKGIWMGGPVPYGYRVENRKLLVVSEEADKVREMYSRYIGLRSVPALVSALREEGFVTRRRVEKDRIKGGVPLTNGPLAAILTNRVYLGELNHRGQSFDGEHEAIVDIEVFKEVQHILAENRNHRAERWQASGAILMGKIVDDRGNRMTPSFASKKGVRYRYYTSRAIMTGEKDKAGSLPRVAASSVEDAVLDAMRMKEENTRQKTGIDPAAEGVLLDSLDSVIVSRERLLIHLVPQDGEKAEVITLPWTPPAAPRREIILAEGADSSTSPIRAEARARLLMAVARARHWFDGLVDGRIASTGDIALREGISERSVRMTLNLAFLSPAIIEATINGTLPHGVGMSRLSELPDQWNEQWDMVAPKLHAGLASDLTGSTHAAAGQLAHRPKRRSPRPC